MRLGIDATNIGGGGGVTHLKEILNSFASLDYSSGIDHVFVFSSVAVLEQLPDSNKVSKVTFPDLNYGLVRRIRFQFLKFDSELRKRCDILFSITGDYTGSFRPLVGMSRNMLLYERDIWREIKQPKEVLRFWLNFQKQKICFNNSLGIIFISSFAKKYANEVLDIHKKKQVIIHHGISPQFRGEVRTQKPLSEYSFEKPLNFLYVSTVHVYKNQWNVVKAISNLRRKGYPVTLTLVGGVIFGPAGDLLTKTILEEDPTGKFVTNVGHIPYGEISRFYKKASGIIYASHCENMPNILIESMCSGVPIVCSNKAPMPEFLKDNGYYFDPKDVKSLENAIVDFLSQPFQRDQMAKNNLLEIENFSWRKTAEETFKFISHLYLHQK